MIWFLLVCTNVNQQPTCLAAQRMPSQKACEFVAEKYRIIGSELNAPTNAARTRCVGVR